MSEGIPDDDPPPVPPDRPSIDLRRSSILYTLAFLLSLYLLNVDALSSQVLYHLFSKLLPTGLVFYISLSFCASHDVVEASVKHKHFHCPTENKACCR